MEGKNTRTHFNLSLSKGQVPSNDKFLLLCLCCQSAVGKLITSYVIDFINVRQIVMEIVKS